MVIQSKLHITANRQTNMFTTIKLYFEQFKAILIGILFVLTFVAGVYVTHLYYSDKIAKQIEATQIAQTKLAASLANVRVEYVKGIDTITYVDKVRTVNIPTYVNLPAGPNKCVTDGFIEVVNAAADSRDLKPMTTEEKDADSATVNMQDVARVVDANYTMCNKYIEQIKALQSTVSLFKETYGAK